MSLICKLYGHGPIDSIIIIIRSQVMDLDRRVRRGRERLTQEVEVPPPPSISAEKSEQLTGLEERIKNLLEQVETLGEAGKVDEAEALMRKVVLSMNILFVISIANFPICRLLEYRNFSKNVC